MQTTVKKNDIEDELEDMLNKMEKKYNGPGGTGVDLEKNSDNKMIFDKSHNIGLEEMDVILNSMNEKPKENW